MLGIRAAGSLYLYDWKTSKLARRIDVDAKLVFWSENGDFIAIATDDGCFILKLDRDVCATLSKSWLTLFHTYSLSLYLSLSSKLCSSW